jgi:hypothetical protein
VDPIVRGEPRLLADGTREYRIVVEFALNDSGIWERRAARWEGYNDDIGYDHGVYEFAGSPSCLGRAVAHGLIVDAGESLFLEGRHYVIRTRIVETWSQRSYTDIWRFACTKTLLNGGELAADAH